MDIVKALNKLKDRASNILKDPSRASNLVEKVQEKYNKRSLPRFSDFMEDMELAISMVKDYASGKYTKPPWQSLILLVGAFIYFLNPMDVVPDFIPLQGLLDDASVLVYVFRSMKEHLLEYDQWKNEQEEDNQ